MGLPGFISEFLKKKYGKDPRFTGIFLHRIPNNIHTLAIDMNGMIHAGFAMAWGFERNKNNPERTRRMLTYSTSKRLAIIFRTIFTILERTVEVIAPSHTLLICVDGITPLSKMFQQRERRFKGMVMADGKRHDTSFVTVGTDFMIAFDIALRGYFVDKRTLFPPNIVYSNHLVPGEGEAKIMHYLREHLTPSSNTAIYGLDADLVMLSLISPETNIYLVREDVRNILNIERLKKALLSETSEELQATMLKDFVALIFHIGNDFLPGGPLHKSIYDYVEGLLSCYKKVNKPLTLEGIDASTIDFRVMGEILEIFGPIEAKLCSKESVNVDFNHHSNRFLLSGLQERPLENTDRKVRYFDYPRFRSIWYNNEFLPCGQESDWGLLPLPTNEDIVEMCQRYCEGLAWTFRYYQTTKVNTEWYFPYHHAPLKMDVAVYLTKTDDGKLNKLNNIALGDGTIHHSPLEQLLSVIHPNSVAVSIPSFVSDLVQDHASEIADFYPIGMIVEKDGVSTEMSYVYRGIQTPLDIERVKEAVRKMDIIPSIRMQYLPESTLTFVGNLENWEARRNTFRSQRIPRPKTEVAPSLKSPTNPSKPGGIQYPVIAGRSTEPRDIRGNISKASQQGFALRGMRTQYDSTIVAPAKRSNLPEPSYPEGNPRSGESEKKPYTGSEKKQYGGSEKKQYGGSEKKPYTGSEKKSYGGSEKKPYTGSEKKPYGGGNKKWKEYEKKEKKVVSFQEKKD